MGYAEATLAGDERIEVRTHTTPGVNDFDFMLAACKRVPGGRFANRRATGDKFWHYPLSLDTCHALRAAFGDALRVHEELSAWYRKEAAASAAHTELSAAGDASLARVPEAFSAWLHGYQRAGARWIAEGYRGSGLVADKPGVGKTPETLAALLEGDVKGPVLVTCPKKSVRLVWGLEAKRHLPGVPVYLCYGNRERREREIARLREDIGRDPHALRIVVIVAEMLRVKLGNPCFTKQLNEKGVEVPNNKVSGMCPHLRRNPGLLECPLHIQVPPPKDAGKAKVKKWLAPVGFEYPELFNKELLGGGWAWTILDESHRLLGSLTISKGNLMGKGLALLPERDRRRYALTGTPFGKGGRAQGLFGTLHWLWPDEYTSYWKWAKEIFEVEESVIGYDRYARAPKTALNVGNLKGLRSDATPEQEAEAWEKFLRSLGPRILRRSKEETFEHLEPKTYYSIACELTAAQKKQNDELIEFAEITTKGGVITANGSLALMTRARQIALGELTRDAAGEVHFGEASGKIDRLWDALEERGILDGAPGEKILIASRYNEFLDAISEYLNLDEVPHFRLDGRTSDSKSERIITAWQTTDCEQRVMLVNVKAGGVSINLDAADELHMMDEDTDPGVNEQMEDRIHRASRIHKVRIYYYRTEGTVEYKIAEDVEFRRRVQHAVMDGRRGVEDIRNLMIEAQGEAV